MLPHDARRAPLSICPSQVRCFSSKTLRNTDESFQELSETHFCQTRALPGMGPLIVSCRWSSARLTQHCSGMNHNAVSAARQTWCASPNQAMLLMWQE